MTEQEAEVWVARLRRIWLPPALSEAQLTWKHNKQGIDCEVQLVQSSSERIEARIIDVLFWTGTRASPNRWYSIEGQRFAQSDGWEQGTLRLGPADMAVVGLEEFGSAQHRQMYGRFVESWLLYFRRNCWLSGADIDATAHEKAEWGRGFSREEIEAWNLKM